MSHKRNWKCAINVLMLITLYMYIQCRPVICPYVKRSAQCKALSVPSCPQSSNAWRFQASERCLNEEMYHCLITELHNPANPDFIECCMPNVNITPGHMPRYSKSRDEIQEIICEDNYFMGVIFASNRFRDNGVEHCKYLKSDCMMEGMKICSEGTTTEDRMCYCDYRNKWVPELPLTDGSHCFFVKDNRCHLVVGCDKPYQELNMMYQCVNVCRDGFYRPEHLIDCIPIPNTTSSTIGSSTIPPPETSAQTKGVHVPDLTTVSTPMPTNELEKKLDADPKATITVAVVVSLLLMCGFLGFVIYCFKVYPKVIIESGIIEATLGSVFSVPCRLKGLSSVYVVSNLHWTRQENKKNAEEEIINVHESETKYKGGSFPALPSLIIQAVDETDGGFYRCVLTYRFKQPLHCIFKRDYQEISAYTYLVVTDSKENTTVKDAGVCVIGHGAQFHVYNNNSNDQKDGNIPLKEINQEVKIPESSYCVTPGNTVELKLETNVKVQEVKWFRKKHSGEGPGKQINVEGRYEGSTKKFPHLIIKRTEESDEGFYCCIIITEDGNEIESNDTFLIILKNDNSRIQNQVWIKKVDTVNAGDKSAVALLDDSASQGDNDNEDSGNASESDHDIDNSYISHGVHTSSSRSSKCLSINQQQPDDKEVNQLQQSNTEMPDLLSEIQKRAADLDFNVEDVAKDGNCFFHAVSQQLTENISTKNYEECLKIANELRCWVVNFLCDNNETPQGTLYSSFASCDFNKYIEELAKPGKYADEICLNVVCNCLQVKICVLSTAGDPKKFIEYVPKCLNPPVIFLGHLHNPDTKDGFHYVRLVPKGAVQEKSNQKESSV